MNPFSQNADPALAALEPLGVALVAMDRRMINLLELFFQNYCMKRYYVEAEGKADLCILDLDGYQGRELWNEQVRQYPKRPIILLAFNDPEISNVLVLRKPVTMKKLQTTLAEAREQLSAVQGKAPAIEAPRPALTPSSPPETPPGKAGEPASVERPSAVGATSQAPEAETPSEAKASRAAMLLDEMKDHPVIGSAPDIDGTDPKQFPRVQFDPGSYLLGHVVQAVELAKKKDLPVRLEHPRGGITFYPDGRDVLVEMSERQLYILSSVPIQSRDVSIKTLKAPPVKGPGAESMSQGALLWQLTLWSARGRIPQTIQPTDLVVLRHWPNMTRLQGFPHAIRIAALLMQGPRSLIDTAGVLGVPQRFVFAFYSAASMVGLAMPSRRSADKLFQAELPQQHRNQGLFRRILNRLKFS